MTYAASYFRSNIGEILDKTKYNREFTTIGRRGKKEFYIISAKLWEEKNIGEKFIDEYETVTDNKIVNLFNSVNGGKSSSITFG
ncbi:MAG: type II toxin-antitoxin system Phd/YefM family antitoxin [Candidatus Gracilibacteria bacterium]|nr:type II toxin-antitoxin system Phd/YefM family antitoxin [Candidatus Gracilibacteria bacterium]MDQ7022539.1 type II toxin-antitoxin system Phd/YefM family antitoxin [Candidatus Gracilibacteria bacterium]